MSTTILHRENIYLKFIKGFGLPTCAILIGFLLDFFSRGFSVFGYLLCLIMLLAYKSYFVKSITERNFVVLAIFSTTYGLFYTLSLKSGVQFIFLYMFFPPFFYLWGRLIANKIEEARNLLILIFLLSFFFSFAAMVSVGINYMQGGFIQLDRSIPMFWSDQKVTPTIMSTYLTLNMCIPAILIIPNLKMNLFTKIFLGVVFLISLVCVLRLGSRTQLGIFLISILISIAYNWKKNSLRQNIRILFVIGAGILVISRYVSFDLDSDWLTAFAGRLKDSDNNIQNGGGRTDRWVKSIENLFRKPLGWEIDEFGFSHNLWLDALRAAGVIPLFFLLVFSNQVFKTLRQALKLNTSYLPLNVTLIVTFLSFFLVFMVEPILDGMFSLFVFFCIFVGIISQYVERLKKQALDKK